MSPAITRSRRPTVEPTTRIPRARLGLAILLAIGLVTAATASALGRSDEAAAPAEPPAAADGQPTPPATTERVSVGADGRQGNGASGGLNGLVENMNPDQAISADGRWVVFVSAATNLVPGEDHPAGGIFLRDRGAGTTIAVPWIGGGPFPATAQGAEPVISGDGLVVAFTVIVSNSFGAAILATSSAPYVLAWDRQTNTTDVVSVDAEGKPLPGYQPTISADGRYVAYTRWYVDSTPPVLSNLTTDGFLSGGQYYAYGPAAPCTPHVATISVTATDPDDAVTSVTLFYQPNGSGVLSTAMSNVSGNLWRATITVLDAWSVGQITYWVQARDSHNNTSPTLLNASNFLLNKGSCIL
jgi:WD40-like Beta Propeller Repeat